MNDYVIIGDSGGDLSPELIEKTGLVIIPMEFEADGEKYYNDPDGRELEFTEFYSMLRNGKLSVTMQINPSRYKEILKPILEDGKDVLIITLSSGLSGTYNASLLAVEELSEKYPDRKIYSVDSLSASMGEGLLAYYAACLKNEGKTIDEVRDWLLENRCRLCHWFTVDDLKHLHRGGRVSAASAVVGTMLGIKPVLHVDDEGHLIPVEKVRGRSAALAALVRHLEETIKEPEGQTIFISHGDAYEEACRVRDMVAEKYGSKIKEFCINYIGPVIGTHSGPGTLAIFFLGLPR